MGVSFLPVEGDSGGRAYVAGLHSALPRAGRQVRGPHRPPERRPPSRFTDAQVETLRAAHTLGGAKQIPWPPVNPLSIGTLNELDRLFLLNCARSTPPDARE